MSRIEQWKYEKAYELENYHLQGRREIVVYEDIDAMQRGLTYLDVGCGDGRSLNHARLRGLDAWGVEIVPALVALDKQILDADIEELPFDNGAFHYVSCYDVLEHLPPGTEQQSLDELGRVAEKQLILTTNEQPSRLPTGEDLHINKRSLGTWNNDIMARWQDCADIFFKKYGNLDCEWHWRIVFKS